MNDEILAIAGDFPATSYDEWRGAVDKALKGAPFEKKLVSKLYEGITVQPIYRRTDWPSEGDPSGFPGAMPFTRGCGAAGAGPDGWDVRQEHSHPDVKAGNDEILTDLERGVGSGLIQFDQAAQAGLDADAASAESLAGRDGVMVYSVDDLDALLAEVSLDIAPVSLDAGAQYLPAAALLAALWRRRNVAPGVALGAFNADPLAVLASTGALPTTVDTALARMADLAALTAATYPKVTAVGVNTSVYYDAGANEAQDLACSMATGVAYLRAMTQAGMSVDAACRQIVFTFSVGCDFFLTMTKLRAARKMWARIAESCGASESARAMTIFARTADRMMTRRDPWVNMLRTTTAAFAAGVAGANAVSVLPFDASLGLPGGLGRRIARNAQTVLREESSLTRVVDPAGGSWYVESLTDELARVAWTTFQEIEKAGGMVNALSNGMIAERIAASHAEREKNIGKRKDPITGVSEFPNITESPVESPKPDLKALRAEATKRLDALRSQRVTALAAAASMRSVDRAVLGQGKLAAAAIDAAAVGATLGTLAEALSALGGGATVKALPRHRLSETFETLRDQADAFKVKTGAWPRIFLANMGPVAHHTGRATFAKNFFETGGIETLGNNGFADAESCVKAFKDSGASMAILCSSDALYEGFVPSTAPALKQAGCSYLFLAGNPGEKKQAYSEAGVDDYIFLGGDVLGTLRATLARLGVTK
ncbi:MAG: methylmalonyl-CoA mutase small subunit [Alphaproteobacteria bacterium]|nr:methylmalonyl-CoA mutase small subunit [Alphaproteobacteria bacterium]